MDYNLHNPTIIETVVMWEHKIYDIFYFRASLEVKKYCSRQKILLRFFMYFDSNPHILKKVF